MLPSEPAALAAPEGTGSAGTLRDGVGSDSGNAEAAGKGRIFVVLETPVAGVARPWLAAGAGCAVSCARGGITELEGWIDSATTGSTAAVISPHPEAEGRRAEPTRRVIRRYTKKMAATFAARTEACRRARDTTCPAAAYVR